MGAKSTFVTSILVFTALLFVVPPGLLGSDLGNTILTIGTFLFGIFAGFCILVTTTDYNIVRDLAADETAGWINLFNQLRIYNEDAASELNPLIENYIIRSFDYDFLNYARETKAEFAKVTEFITSLRYIEERSSVHQNIVDTFSGITAARQRLTALGKRSLSVVEWSVLLVLSLVVIATLYVVGPSSPFFNFVTVAVSSAIVLILVLIRDIDRYVWNDAAFSFEVFNNVLLSLGKLPYYPIEFVKTGIVAPFERVYRLGTLLEPGKSWRRDIKVIEKA